MRLKVRFGLVDEKDVDWWRAILDFPVIINFSGKNFEFVFYDTDKTGTFDYILTFSELQPYDTNYSLVCSTWMELFGEKGGCECGSKFDKDSPDGHFFYCKLWRGK